MSSDETLRGALEGLIASCTRTKPGLHDDCGTRIVTAPSVEALKAARAALSRTAESSPPNHRTNPMDERRLTAEALLSHLLEIETRLCETIEDFEPGLLSLQRRRAIELNHLLGKVLVNKEQGE